MCMIDGCDSYWARHESTTPTARVEHACAECKRTIQPGESYERSRGLMIAEGEPVWIDHKICLHCQAAAEWLKLNCGGYVIEWLREDLKEHFEESAVFPPGHTVWLGRAVIGMRRKWEGLPVPKPAQKMESEREAA